MASTVHFIIKEHFNFEIMDYFFVLCDFLGFFFLLIFHNGKDKKLT